MKRLLPSLLILIFWMGCAQMEHLKPRSSGEPDGRRPESPLTIGMSSLQVVKTIGFPVNGTRITPCNGVKRDVWVYEGGDLMLVFENGQLSKMVGLGGERPSIRLYR